MITPRIVSTVGVNTPPKVPKRRELPSERVIVRSASKMFFGNLILAVRPRRGLLFVALVLVVGILVSEISPGKGILPECPIEPFA